MVDQNNTNTKITVAVLGEKMDSLTNTVVEACSDMKIHTKRTSEVETCIAVLKSEFENLDDRMYDMKTDMNDMKDKNKLANIGIAAGEILIGILAAIGIRQ